MSETNVFSLDETRDAETLAQEIRVMCLVMTHPGNHKTKALKVNIANRIRILVFGVPWSNKCFSRRWKKAIFKMHEQPFSSIILFFVADITLTSMKSKKSQSQKQSTAPFSYPWLNDPIPLFGTPSTPVHLQIFLYLVYKGFLRFNIQQWEIENVMPHSQFMNRE